MASTQYDATGVLVLKVITPVIRAIFGVFNLGSAINEGEVYIAFVAERSDPTWDGIQSDLAELAVEMGLCANAEDSSAALDLLFAHFGFADAEWIESIKSLAANCEQVAVEEAFALATQLDDGHGLTAVKFEGAWHCDKPVLFEFGGNGRYCSAVFNMERSSSTALTLGNKVSKHLAAGEVPEAARALSEDILNTLNGITDDAQRAAVTKTIAAKLSA